MGGLLPTLQVHSYSRDFDGVLAAWRRMAADGFCPTAKLWGSLLVACSAAGQMEQAAIFWWEMKQLQMEANSRRAAAQNQEDVAAAGGATVDSGSCSTSASGSAPGDSPQSGCGSDVITTDNLCAMMTACNDAGQVRQQLLACVAKLAHSQSNKLRSLQASQAALCLSRPS